MEVEKEAQSFSSWETVNVWRSRIVHAGSSSRVLEDAFANILCDHRTAGWNIDGWLLLDALLFDISKQHTHHEVSKLYAMVVENVNECPSSVQIPDFFLQHYMEHDEGAFFCMFICLASARKKGQASDPINLSLLSFVASIMQDINSGKAASSGISHTENFAILRQVQELLAEQAHTFVQKKSS